MVSTVARYTSTGACCHKNVFNQLYFFFLGTFKKKRNVNNLKVCAYRVKNKITREKY